LFELIKPIQTLQDIILPKGLENSLKMIVKEIKNKEKLDDWGIQEFGRILLHGPPGTGKTLWAHVLTNELGYELLYVRLDTLISSYLGETGKNIRKIFDIANGCNVVLFIDEFDAIAKMRDDSRELGELKRVVNVLIQNIDDFKSNSVLVAATNHPHLLDVAIWRRFDEILVFDLPDKNAREKIFKIHSRQIPLNKVNSKDIVKNTGNFSGDDIRKMVRHAVRYAIQNNREFVNSEDFDEAIKIIYTRKTHETTNKEINKIALAKSYKKKGYSYPDIAKTIHVSTSTAWRYVNKPNR
jgi:SpoVK/Ycf46/Vps4 family AAA+-type ATPase